MLLTTHIRRRHYRVLVTDGRILGVEQRVAILHGQRAPLVYWKRVWRVGRPAWPFLLPVLEDARRQLLPKIRFAAVDDIDAIKRWAAYHRVEIPPWVWPDWPPPKPPPRRPQVQDWRLRREPGGWPPRVEPAGLSSTGD